MNLKHTTKTIFLNGLVAAFLMLGSCQNAPKNNIDKINSLKKQVQANAKTLHDIEVNDFVSLQRDFRACDSMLQYLDPQQVDKAFETLQLVQAYLEQFKITKPLIQADMDSTLLQLDRLKADAESQYLSDSLVEVYLTTETQFADKLNNQVGYFKDRFNTCQKNLDAIKKLR